MRIAFMDKPEFPAPVQGALLARHTGAIIKAPGNER
jgi:hypothetical protein